MPVPWNDDDPRDLATLEQNLGDLLRQLVLDAPKRVSPTIELAKSWHRRTFRKVRLPVSYYAGEIRDSDSKLPELFGYEVAVGSLPGAPSRDVPEQLRRFEDFMKDAVERLDPLVPLDQAASDPDSLDSIVTLCAISHGEWNRIHPFANGNGRTARLWGNWCALRYGLPPFIRLRPRPGGNAYADAAAASMGGDHRPMVEVFLDLLTLRLSPSR